MSSALSITNRRFSAIAQDFPKPSFYLLFFSVSLKNRSLETVAKVFHALTEAVEKWEGPQDFSARRRAT